MMSFSRGVYKGAYVFMAYSIRIYGVYGAYSNDFLVKSFILLTGPLW